MSQEKIDQLYNLVQLQTDILKEVPSGSHPVTGLKITITPDSDDENKLNVEVKYTRQSQNNLKFTFTAGALSPDAFKAKVMAVMQANFVEEDQYYVDAADHFYGYEGPKLK